MTFVFIHSLQMRCTILNSSGDDLLRVLLFWSVFLPLGKCFSVDRYILEKTETATLKPTEAKSVETINEDNEPAEEIPTSTTESPKSISNFFTFAVLQQALFVYWVGALLKSNPIWTSKYSAIEWTLHLGHFATPFGTWFVVAMKSYLKPLTQFVLLLELYGPLLMLVPFAMKYIRTTTMFLLIGMHLNFVLFMQLGYFPFISICSLILFFPTELWDWLQSKEKVTDNIFTKYWTLLILRFAKWHKFLNVYLSWASHRHRVSKLGYGIAISAFAIVLHTNLNVIMPKTITDKNITLKRIRWGSGLYQNWTMFAPYPLKFTLWPKFVGTTKSGQEVDVFLSNHTYHGATVAFVDKRPDNILGNYTNYRWRKFHGNIRQNKYKYFRGNYAKYECRLYNDKHPDDKITKLSLKMGLQWSPVDGTKNLLSEIDMGNYTCR